MVEKDRFGLKHMTQEQEIAVSFSLLILGAVFILSSLVTLIGHSSLNMGLIGLLMIGTSYFFVIESVRELEEEDHFLSRKLKERE